AGSPSSCTPSSTTPTTPPGVPSSTCGPWSLAPPRGPDEPPPHAIEAVFPARPAPERLHRRGRQPERLAARRRPARRREALAPAGGRLDGDLRGRDRAERRVRPGD